MRKTGLSDFGNDFWDEPLERLIRSIDREAMLHPVGRFITKERLVNLLSTRLRAEWWFKKHPEILDQQLYPVCLITGLQRTGTTKLQRLLSADPDNRPLLSWEALNPAPLERRLTQPDPRIKVAHRSERALKLMAPDFFAIHPVEHMAPEEDILLLDVSFLSTTPEATMHVPEYATWLEKTDNAPAYAYAVKLLKFLQWQRPAKRWVLKSPHHLEFLPVVQKYFGEVSILWTHREVEQCLPSFLSMVSFSRAIFSTEVNTDQVAKHWIRKTGYMLSRAMSFRKIPGHERFFTDILYKRFIEQPIETLNLVYENIGMNAGALEGLFREADGANPRAKYGLHHYQLSDFGLTDADLHKHMASYQRYVEKLMDTTTDQGKQHG
jgi:hypothetical protein